MNLDIIPTPFAKINSMWITGLNVEYKTLKLGEDIIIENVDILVGNDLLDTTPINLDLYLRLCIFF